MHRSEPSPYVSQDVTTLAQGRGVVGSQTQGETFAVMAGEEEENPCRGSSSVIGPRSVGLAIVTVEAQGWR